MVRDGSWFRTKRYSILTIHIIRLKSAIFLAGFFSKGYNKQTMEKLSIWRWYREIEYP